jgi:hypothetical protein
LGSGSCRTRTCSSTSARSTTRSCSKRPARDQMVLDRCRTSSGKSGRSSYPCGCSSPGGPEWTPANMRNPHGWVGWVCEKTPSLRDGAVLGAVPVFGYPAIIVTRRSPSVP